MITQNLLLLVFLVTSTLFFSNAFAMTELYGIDSIDFELIETSVVSIPYWIEEPLDTSDILKVKFKITNNGPETFLIYKDMFRIDVEDLSIIYREPSRSPNDFLVENYYPEYSEDFKLRFQDLPIEQTYNDCVLIDHGIPANQSMTLTICFDIKRKWHMESLDLIGDKQYYLVMMDNKFAYSCPNCIRVLLTSAPILQTDIKNKIIPESVYPLKQLKSGKLLNEIICKDKHILMLKYTGKPACVKYSSVKKLVERGWGMPA
jgi:hypothetical protein